ncbi:hypothetical protein [Nocardia terpenica]|uniref:Uncharacterized protein n=1 Tax=Nocardia terpenica TaxID=455432 RepID=A0A164JVZ0_9NOCA|nr:hypothetical protein [Nocardia terpenica]KZM70775.1 hypothetical protein AWN90_40170 [Nocardia terpenica]NQE89958.1 hypothetical protein [Nocardia terpenica]
MAREFARIRLSIWEDEPYLDLTPAAQHLYYVLTTDPGLSYCGCVDWRPARLRPRARGWTRPQIHAAAAELEAARFVLFDPDTEEALVRSLIRSDELLRNPKLALAVVKAYGALASRTLRAAVVTELKRDRHEHPEYSSWSHSMSAVQLSRLLSLPDLDTVGYTHRITDPVPVGETPRIAPITNGITNPNADQNGYRITNLIGDAEPVANTDADRSVSPIPTTDRITSAIGDADRSVSYQQTADSRQQTSGGSVTGVRHVPEPLPPPDDPPSTFHPGHETGPVAPAQTGPGEPSQWCDRHPGGTPDPCRACQTARQAHHEWQRDRAERRRVAADHKRADIADCALCDEAGWRTPPAELRDADPPVVRCNHKPGELPAAWRALITHMLDTTEETKPDE